MSIDNSHCTPSNETQQRAGLVYSLLVPVSCKRHVLHSSDYLHVGRNYVDSPTWKYNSSAFVQNPSFFFMMHYSRFVPPGSVVIDASVTCGARHKEYCQFVAFRVPNGNVVVVMTNDEITVGPIAGTSVGPILTPHLAKGQGSITVGAKTLSWSVQVTCKGKDKPVYVEGTLPWKAIQTVVIPC